jgi:hypothetical protein
MPIKSYIPGGVFKRKTKLNELLYHHLEQAMNEIYMET